MTPLETILIDGHQRAPHLVNAVDDVTPLETILIDGHFLTHNEPPITFSDSA